MEERSLRITGADKTFFNKITNTLTKMLIPTKIGINGMLISLKRNSLIKAFENYKNEEKGNYNKEELEKKYDTAYEAYLDAPIVHLSLDNLTNTGKSFTNASAFLRGIVTYSYKSTALNRFNTIKDIQTKDLPIIQTFGAGVAIKGEGENKQNETEEEFINRVNHEQKNIL